MSAICSSSEEDETDEEEDEIDELTVSDAVHVAADGAIDEDDNHVENSDDDNLPSQTNVALAKR